MAYITKALNLVAPNVGTNLGGSVWSYWNPDGDNLAALVAANYITDALDKGMEPGDIVLSIIDTGGAVSLGVLTVAASGADLV